MNEDQPKPPFEDREEDDFLMRFIIHDLRIHLWELAAEHLPPEAMKRYDRLDRMISLRLQCLEEGIKFSWKTAEEHGFLSRSCYEMFPEFLGGRTAEEGEAIFRAAKKKRDEQKKA